VEETCIGCALSSTVAVLHDRGVVHDALLLKLLVVSVLPGGIRVCVVSAVFMQ
jgi:hypothetical protein